MHNTYFSSAIGFRSKGSLSISLNDYYCVLNERTERLSSSSCTCCAFSIHGVPINPRFLYGSRQSTLIHWSASRRLILGGLDRYCRLPIYDLDQGCHGIPCSLKERSITRRRRRRVGRFGCMGSEEKNETCNSGIDGSTEAMLSLLSEDVCGKFVGVGEWIGRSASGRVLVEKRGRIVDECLMEEKEQAESNSLERNSKSDFGSATIKLRDECNQWEGRRENSSSRESRGEKKVGSSCSSYYSMSASGDIESDADVQIRHREFDEESSIDYKRNELRRNKEGVLVREDKKQFKRHEEDVGDYREALARRNASVETYATENAVEWDLRNKAEKKRTEELVGKIGSREKYSQKFSKGLELHESGLQRTSSYHKQFNEREEVSTSARNSVKETAEHDSQRGVLVNEQSESRRKSQQVKKMSEIHESDFPMASSSEKQFSGREKNLNSAVNLVQEARERNVEQIESRRKSQQLTEVLETNDSERETNSASQMHFETRMKNTEENSTSVWSSVQKANERQTQSDQRVFGRTESRRDSQYLTNTSVTSAGDAKTITSSQTPFEARISNREGNLTSVVDLVQEDRERNNQTGERVIEQVGPRKEFQRAAKVSSFRNSTVERDHSSQAPLNLVPQTRVQQMRASTEDEKKSQVMVTPPPSQSVVRGSTDAKPTSGYATIKVSGEFSESSSSALLTHPQGKTPASLHEVDSETRSDETYGEHSRPMVHEDVLSSANQFQKSSTQFVGEFVEKLQDQVLTAEIQKERSSSETTSVYKDKKNIQQGSRRSSDVSGTKGPTDEMWDVVDPSLQEPARIDAPEEGTATTGSAVVRKTNKSLWSIIADIVRLRWGARAETNNSAVKSGGRSSSNESVSSEAWFSGYEPDENDNENVKRGRRSTPKESRPAGQLQLGKALTRSQREASEATISPDRISQIEADTSSYSGALERFTPSQGASSASREENYGWKEAGKRGQDFPSTIATVESSSPLPSRQLIRSPVIEQKPESGKDEVFRSGFKEQLEQPIQERLIEVSGTEGKDGELKRRKLQRNKQVLVERFDEWEEAYKLETEQRKNDEMFMREALLEAKKAADTWEVPVGAVLVQHGKIIARGCNLVEELRDSTAHAEMICIREASNLLRTWRLAETTLYVTLEPCPMCAGAILQARIDTVVWGAPNKLLGADGSWVRLFPGGGGGSGSDLTNQPAGPIHPFHPNMTIRRGVLATECADVMQQFFQLRRRKKEKKPESPSPPQSLPISSHPSKFLSKMHGIFNIMFCL